MLRLTVVLLVVGLMVGTSHAQNCADATACLNGGTCPDPNNAPCTCVAPWSGDTCADACTSAGNECQNGGTCDAAATPSVCTCPAALRGSQCNQNATCAECKTAYDANKGTNACNAAKDYAQCLFTATSCTTLAADAAALNTDIAALGASCSLTAACQCQMTFLQADVSTTINKCLATITLNTCMLTETSDGCGTTATTNTALKTSVAALYSACSSGAVVKFSMVSLLAVIGGVFLKN